MIARTLEYRSAFAGRVPAPLAAMRLLGVPLFGGAAREVKLDGPQLMWGRMLAALPGVERSGGLKRMLFKSLKALFVVWALGVIFFAAPLIAQGFPNIKPTIVERADTPEDVTSTIELLLLLTVLSVAPGILIMTTAFTRIVIVFGFLRMALSTQQLPPTQVLTGMAMILTFLIMRPTINEIRHDALVPYLDAEITQAEAFDRSVQSLRRFMFSQVANDDLRMFGELSGDKPLEWTKHEDVDTFVLMPAFVLSELKRGFYMGFMLFIPFMIIDLVVSTVLISMGMLVLPPVLISLPFKILLFVLVDGWSLLVMS
ncbi:MAG: flagellar type III secretion system pore protein FliP, partial [Planctomycetes bacterium]|nr:flagellar type III secretion system pore protein FliP [Planctomycetota bacterium]